MSGGRADGLRPVGPLARAQQAATLDGSIHEQAQRRGAFDRLLDVVEGAALHRLHRRLDRCVGREQDDLRVGKLGPHLGQEGEPAAAGHLEVGDDHVERLAVQDLGRFTAVGGRHDVVSVSGQRRGEQRPQPLLVVDHQNAGHSPDSLASGLRSTAARSSGSSIGPLASADEPSRLKPVRRNASRARTAAGVPEGRWPCGCARCATAQSSAAGNTALAVGDRSVAAAVFVSRSDLEMEHDKVRDARVVKYGLARQPAGTRSRDKPEISSN